MDYYSKYKRQVFSRLLIGSLFVSATTIGAAAFVYYFTNIELLYGFILVSAVSLFASLLISFTLTPSIASPVDKLSQLITFISRDTNQAAPDIEKLHVARELVQAMNFELYNIASASKQNAAANESITSQSTATQEQAAKPTSAAHLNGLAVPIIGIDSQQNVTFANNATAEYLQKPLDQIQGKPLYDSLKLSFQSDNNFEDWLNQSQQQTVTATETWERVRHIIDQDNAKQFDLVASFSSGSSSGTETMLAIFDRTTRYNQDDQEVSFVALAVHELRTPLTIMRGYIEVFEDELGPTLTPELTDFMHKMHASAQQLTAFVSNILNVARIEENQLALKLRQENWSSLLQTAVSDLELRAQVHGIHIELRVADNLPPVAIDRTSAHEIINNLVDNAIKYSDKADKIVITAQVNNDGLVETNVQDFGIGMPASVLGDLFQKFHRSHKSRVQVGGTGLGLYLCKALVSAHGGNIWVRSKEGEGSVFSFTLLPYDQLSKEQVEGEDGIIRGAHGWIKNHSLYRG